jgi:hypothetical protein
MRLLLEFHDADKIFHIDCGIFQSRMWMLCGILAKYNFKYSFNQPVIADRNMCNG